MASNRGVSLLQGLVSLKPSTPRVTPSPRHLSSSTAPAGGPRFQVPAHVAAFSLLLLPALAYAAYAERYGPSREELEATIRERYGAQLAADADPAERRAMQEMFQRAVMKPDGSFDATLDQVLKAGRDNAGRRAVELPTTAKDSAVVAGAKAKVVPVKGNQTRADVAPLEIRKKKRRQERPVKQDQDKTGGSLVSDTTKSIVLVTTVAALAATAGFLAGGKRQ